MMFSLGERGSRVWTKREEGHGLPVAYPVVYPWSIFAGCGQNVGLAMAYLMAYCMAYRWSIVLKLGSALL